MRQRAMIAMALLFTPDLVIMDEPTSALDVVAQRSLMVQIKELQRQLGFAVVFVTHDMSLVSHFSDQLLVMYAGQVVEAGPTRTVFDTPSHPYSRGLLDAFPSIRGPRVPLTGIPGSAARPRPGRSPAAGSQPAAQVQERRAARSRRSSTRSAASQARCLLHAQSSAGAARRAWRRHAMTASMPVAATASTTSRPAARDPRSDQAFQGRRQRSPARRCTPSTTSTSSIGRSEIVALVGESGSGKSTIARLLARVYQPTSGEILYQGRSLSQHAHAARQTWPTAATYRWCSRTRSAR